MMTYHASGGHRYGSEHVVGHRVSAFVSAASRSGLGTAEAAACLPQHGRQQRYE